jgi:hypothetical protein
MSDAKHSRQPVGEVAPLSIERLEAGLRILIEGDVDSDGFWDENVAAFRQTVLFAIRETAEALLSPTIPLHWRTELEGQLEPLLGYLELANRRLAMRLPDASVH